MMFFRKKRSGGRFLLGMFVGACVVLFFIGLFSFQSYADKVGVVRVKGAITSSPSIFMMGTTPGEVMGQLEAAEADPSVKAVLVEIDSPGGSVVASREMSIAMKRFSKPTICWLGDLAASGAYWVASSCDLIVADPLSLTGSIGVTASYLQFSGTMEKYGVEYERLVSGEDKDTGSPFRDLTESQEESMMRLINETFEYFLDDVVVNRNLTSEQVDVIKGAGIFLAKDGVALGLVDELGTWQDAKDIAKNVSGTVQPQFVELRSSGINLLELLQLLY